MNNTEKLVEKIQNLTSTKTNPDREEIFEQILVIPFFFLAVWIVMLLWNALLPDIFGLPVITFWQAAGIKILFRLLFTSIKK